MIAGGGSAEGPAVLLRRPHNARHSDAERLGNRRYLDSGRRLTFNEHGIFRCCPELDG
jgi:hypothetical protein